jgi:hypothetical protein
MGLCEMTHSTLDDYIESEIEEANLDNERLTGIFNWIVRFVISFSLMIILGFILNYTLIEPYSIKMLELSIEFNYEPAAKKGDREI